MSVQDNLKETRAQVEKLVKQAQDAVNVLVEANKKAYDVVVDTAQTLAKTETAAAKDIYSTAVESFNKAKQDGIKTVASKPAEYVPAQGKDRAVAAYKETVEVLTKSQDKLVKVAKKGYKDVVAEFKDKPAPKKTTAAKKPAAKRTPAKKAPAKKTAAAA